MKKNRITICLILLASIATQAQIVKFGIKGGFNYANQTGTDITVNSTTYKSEAITNYHFGLVAEFPLGNTLAIQPELLYSTVGANYKQSGMMLYYAGTSSIITDFNNKLGYITIPVLAKINLSKTFSLDLGPQASFLLSNKNDVSINDTKSFDFGAAAGLGIKITKGIFLQGRYVVGLSEVSTNAKTKNSVLQVSAGFFF
ncbi:porin family protein [Flavobacterium sp.]|uniref:porin family protein n=1 Tax=Flavobacterium sp. TaxID=239 RepID=UPI00286F243B|nr:porin family protein [Flavobacterium sp.]